MWTRFMWFRRGTMASSCEHGNGPSDAIKEGDIVDSLSDC